jgi:DNA ligase 1
MKLRYDFQLCHHFEDYPLDFSQPKGRNDLKYVAEFKFDGQLAMMIDGKIFSRQGNDVTNRFPEIRKIDDAVIVGEICVVTKDAPTGDFNLILQRKADSNVSIRAKAMPATFMAFDILERTDGMMRRVDLTEKNFSERRALLEAYFEAHKGVLDSWELVDQIEVRSAEDVAQLREKAYEMGIEGFIFKRLSSSWHSGKRTSDFLKLKTVKEEDFKIEHFENTVGEKGNQGFVVYIRNAKGEMQKVAIGSEADREKIRHGRVNVIEVKYLRKSREGVLYQPVLSKLKEDF